tara:strand:- start:573 stop:896 length:324 start_codon:yes stop_codon:yes gene_type:complete
MSKGSWVEFEDSSFKRKIVNSSDSQSKGKDKLRVNKTRSGKKGKTVTVISGLQSSEDQLKQLLKRLKKICGTGGTIKTDCIELQGDHVRGVLELLIQDGYSPKQSGG